jgi:hypothetical protein
MNSTPRSEKMRMHGFMLGAVLLIASLLVASSMTAVVNLVLIAIPVLTIAMVIGIFAVGIPMIFSGIQANKEANSNAAAAHSNAMLLSLEGFWMHSHAWEKGPAHFVGFQPIDHDIVIHLDSKSDDSSMTMREFMQMTSGSQTKKREVEKSLEGLTDYHRV